jgi:hypothetical protein
MKYKAIFLYCSLLVLFSCAEEIDPRVAFEKGDYAKAFSIWKVKAEQDDQEAQNFLGIHYLLGLGVKRNFVLARKWYEKAAKSGHPDAILMHREIWELCMNQVMVWPETSRMRIYGFMLRIDKDIHGQRLLYNLWFQSFPQIIKWS